MVAVWHTPIQLIHHTGIQRIHHTPHTIHHPSGSKKQFRHMNEARFLFFMLRLCHLRNKELVEKGIVPRERDEEVGDSGESSDEDADE